LPAAESVSDRAVRSASGEAQTDRFFHTFAEVLVLDRRGDLGRTPQLAGAGHRRVADLDRSGSRRQRTRREAHLGNPEPLGDLGRALPELEGPDRVGGGDVKRAVTGDPRRPCVARDRRTRSVGPALDELGEARLDAEASELTAELVREPVQESPPRVAPGRREEQTHESP